MLEAFCTLVAFCAVFAAAAVLEEAVHRYRQHRSTNWLNEGNVR